MTSTPTATATGTIRLNLGCGHPSFWFPQSEGWVNVDINPQHSPDLIADCTDLPYPDSSVDEIYAGHVLEHIAEARGQFPLLEWLRVLRPGGCLLVTVPDLFRAARIGFQCGPDQGVTLADAILGSRETDWQHHHRVYTEERLLAEMRPLFAHCLAIEVPAIPWQISVRGYKPAEGEDPLC